MADSQVVFDFTGRRVLVWGNTAGLSSTVIKSFLDRNATVFVIDTEKDTLEKLLGTPAGLNIITIEDMSNWDELQHAVRGILPIHHLVCDAPAIGAAKGFLEYESTDINRDFEINLTGLTAVAQAVAKGMIEGRLQDGTILVVSSISAVTNVPGTLVYGTSKAGYEHLTRIMAHALAPYKIRVNCIRPGFCNVPLVEVIPRELKEKFLGATLHRQVLSKEPIEPEDIARAILAFSSNLFPTMTGAVTPIDCGHGTS